MAFDIEIFGCYARSSRHLLFYKIIIIIIIIIISIIIIIIIINNSILLLQLGGLSRATNKSIFQANWVDHERIFTSWFYTRSITNWAPSIWLCSYVAIFYAVSL